MKVFISPYKMVAIIILIHQKRRRFSDTGFGVDFCVVCHELVSDDEPCDRRTDRQTHSGIVLRRSS